MGKPAQQAGKCPVCGKSDLEYGSSYPEGECVCYPWECRDCKATGEEWYELTFIEHRVNED